MCGLPMPEGSNKINLKPGNMDCNKVRLARPLGAAIEEANYKVANDGQEAAIAHLCTLLTICSNLVPCLLG